jgi:hypothetical protein
MEDSRSSNDKTNTRSSCHVPINTRCIAARLLIAEGNEANTQVDGFLCDLNYWDANWNQKIRISSLK